MKLCKICFRWKRKNEYSKTQWNKHPCIGSKCKKCIQVISFQHNSINTYTIQQSIPIDYKQLQQQKTHNKSNCNSSAVYVHKVPTTESYLVTNYGLTDDIVNIIMCYAIQVEGKFADGWYCGKDCDYHTIILNPNGTFRWEFEYFDDEPGFKTIQQWKLNGEYYVTSVKKCTRIVPSTEKTTMVCKDKKKITKPQLVRLYNIKFEASFCTEHYAHQGCDSWPEECIPDKNIFQQCATIIDVNTDYFSTKRNSSNASTYDYKRFILTVDLKENKHHKEGSNQLTLPNKKTL